MNHWKERFKGKTALVTGAGSGIGKSIAQRLHLEGAKVVGFDINGLSLKELSDELDSRFSSQVGDVTKESDVEDLVSHAQECFGGLDLAFNVAGGNRSGYIPDLGIEDWDFVVDLCLKSVFLCIKHQSRQMLSGCGGAIVNIASVNARVPMHAGSAYAVAKSGVEMLTKNAALELANDNIRVNAVLPGLVETPLTRRHFDNPLALETFIARIPQGRPAQPAEIAGPALFLASNDASYINGSSLIVDGAWAVSGYPDMRPFRGPIKWNG
jgi:NAD(P)-dependent dehydrogenase (short-subunit alcohol dehydrogenase family)